MNKSFLGWFTPTIICR